MGRTGLPLAEQKTWKRGNSGNPDTLKTINYIQGSFKRFKGEASFLPLVKNIILISDTQKHVLDHAPFSGGVGKFLRFFL